MGAMGEDKFILEKVLYFVAWAFLWLYATVVLRKSIHRHANLPAGSKIFVSNHPSATDPFMIHIISRQQMNVLITAKAFSVPVFGWFLRKVREIPVPLKEGSIALDQAGEYIQEGRSVAIFIEGKISPLDGSFLQPRTGAARLALSSGVPIIPVGIYLRRDLCKQIRSKIDGATAEANWYLRGPYAITVGMPMRFEGDVEDRQHVRNVTEKIMDQIRLLAEESRSRIHRLKAPVATMM
jgi:1-acyl-sn-glycerol-3-phosphate acyltransferase